MSRSAIKEITTEEKVPENGEVTKTVHSGQLNVKSAIHDFMKIFSRANPVVVNLMT